MRLKFVKRRYYGTKFREVGEVVDVGARFAKAFLRVGAAVPAPGQPVTAAVPKQEPVEQKKAPAFTRKKKPVVVVKQEVAEAPVEDESPSNQPALFQEDELPEDLPEPEREDE
jgi:hypothetical protein